MGKITISGDSLQEISDTLDELLGAAPANPAATGEAAAKATRTRKKAAAPPPMQPGETAQQQPSTPFTQAPPAQPQASNPFTQAPPAGNPFTPPFGNGAADPHANSHAERPIVTKVKSLLAQLAAEHGEPQVYAWAMQKGLNLSAAISKDDFLNTVIHAQSDADLEEVYRQGGGA
jgi:hypothetical protein